MYELLTSHISELKHTNNYYGENSLFKDIYEFVEKNPSVDMRRYQDILAASNIEWSYDSMIDANVDELDAKTTIALIVGAVRADRFSDGIWQKFIDDGHIERWLVHLKRLDVC